MPQIRPLFHLLQKLSQGGPFNQGLREREEAKRRRGGGGRPEVQGIERRSHSYCTTHHTSKSKTTNKNAALYYPQRVATVSARRRFPKSGRVTVPPRGSVMKVLQIAPPETVHGCYRLRVLLLLREHTTRQRSSVSLSS